MKTRVSKPTKIDYDEDELACAEELASVDGTRRLLGASMAATRKQKDRGLDWIRINTAIANTSNSLLRTELLQQRGAPE